MLESARTFSIFLIPSKIMDITVNKISDCQATLSATVTADEVKTAKASILSSYSSFSRIPGFRPGKAPKSLIEKRYAKEISEELDSRLKGEIQEKTLEENPELKVLDFGTPETSAHEDGSFSLTTTLTIIPEFDLPEYMGIEVTVPSAEVSDAEVEDALQKYAETASEHVVAERASVEGDIVVINFKTSIDGVPTAEAIGKPVGFLEGREGHWVSLSEDRFIPELAEGLTGVSAGESKDIIATLKEDFPITDLAGKSVTFHCEVTEVREKKVPEVNEELFASVLPGKTMDEVRATVRENLKASKERSNDEAKADQISEKLADRLSFALPADLVERENENTTQRKIYEAMQQGDYEAYKNMDSIRENSKAETERNLRVYFALQEIARRESVSASDAEVMEALANMAHQAREKNLKAFVGKMVRENRISGVRLSIVTSKVLSLLARNAKVTIETPQAEEAPAAEAPAEV